VTVLNDVVLSPAANATDYKPPTGPPNACTDASTSAREAFLRVRVSDDFKPSTYVAVYLDNGTQLIVRDSLLCHFHSDAPRAARQCSVADALSAMVRLSEDTGATLESIADDVINHVIRFDQ
jgi:hypothetical protein